MATIWNNPTALAHLKRRWAEGASCAKIAAELSVRHNILVSRNAVIGKIHRLGLDGGRPIGRRPGEPKRPPRRPPKGALEIRNRLIAVRLKARAVHTEPADEQGRKSLLDLEPEDCRYVIGEPSGSLPSFCALPRLPGSPYCVDHHMRTHEQVPVAVRQTARETVEA